MSLLAGKLKKRLSLKKSGAKLHRVSGCGCKKKKKKKCCRKIIIVKVVHKGPKGDRGPRGCRGFRGVQGVQGETGATGEVGATGATGATGERGPKGKKGDDGERGKRGHTGPAGLNGSGTIIPFASGLPATLTTVLNGEVGTTTLVGFGSSVAGVSILNGTINLTGSSTALLNFAFSVPRDGTISSISAYFSTVVGESLPGSSVTVTAQLYQSTTPNNLFTAVKDAFVTLDPALSDTVNIGDIFDGIKTGLAIPVSAGTRLLLVFSAMSTGVDLDNTIMGYASAGLEII